jgi:glyoxylase-like metal-dependent hydrolase (beta-lactamase superfamily II)
MRYILDCLQAGPLNANCYIFGCAVKKEAAIIDPGGEPELIKEKLVNLGLKGICVINTHGHYDHIGANEAFGLPVFAHRADGLRADRFLEEGDSLKIGNLELAVIHTPGHSPGSISLRCGNIIFSGDTLFKESIGRTDIHGGSYDDIMYSIRNKLFCLPDDTKVYPGHGWPTTIGHEKKENPFF